MNFQGRWRKGLMGLVFVLLVAAPAGAALEAVSGLQDGVPPELTAVLAGGDPAQVAVSLAHGFPLWYEDENGLKLELCLDRSLEVAPGVFVAPCEVAAPQLGAPVSFPGNFGAEALYWSAVAAGTFVSSDGLTNAALLALAQEASFANEGPTADGIQAVFSRIRLRIDLPVAGTYRVTHPFGSFDYEVAIPGVRAINQTQDLGVADAQNFLVSMRDLGDAFVVPDPFNPADGDAAGVVNSNGATIGPFLVPLLGHGGVFDAGDPATFIGGPITVGDATYIGLPFAPDPLNPALTLDVFQPVTAGLNGVNLFEITLMNPPAGFFLDADGLDGLIDNTVTFADFQILGKIFNDGANLAPLAEPDIVVGTAINRSRSINVFPNGFDHLDPIAVDNVHGINPQAIAVADPLTGGTALNLNGMPILTGTLPTAMGGTVRRVTAIPTGQATFFYTPPLNFTGVDTFDYVVQDTGGLISLSETVSIVVEDLQAGRADFRVRTGKWQVEGTSSNSDGNVITLYGGPRTFLTPEAEVQIPAVVSDARGSAALRVTETAVEFLLNVEPLPVTTITAAHIHLGATDENGPILFTLFDNLFGEFTSPQTGALTSFSLAPTGLTFAQAIDAILSGNTYVNVHTQAVPAGEIRGQLLRPVIGNAPVVEGLWRFTGPSLKSPGALPNVSAESINGVRVLGVPLMRR
ncbi:CHRD domain-containing protein [Geoalkalibacter sp.]|uniref:CHRD domain-containing protein n=1 Tax=Geoalkalibacter sp. TaxID=3041440 RepID=UPI00272EAF31|nr:CHRD domain-containing protein [Geoalkalibacter sp.]